MAKRNFKTDPITKYEAILHEEAAIRAIKALFAAHKWEDRHLDPDTSGPATSAFSGIMAELEQQLGCLTSQPNEHWHVGFH